MKTYEITAGRTLHAYGADRLSQSRVLATVKKLNAPFIRWAALNPFWAQSAFLSVRRDGRDYIVTLCYTSDQGTSPVTVAFG